MITEHDRVVLTAPVPKERLEIGDVGIVVHVYQDGKAFEVEFTPLDGHTAAVATVEASQVRPVSSREIPTPASWRPADAWGFGAEETRR
jgi:hypothetical protein